MNSIYTLAELEALPTIEQAWTGDLKAKAPKKRVWLSRMTVADGAPYDNQVTIETYTNGSWAPILTYQAK